MVVPLLLGAIGCGSPADTGAAAGAGGSTMGGATGATGGGASATGGTTGATGGGASAVGGATGSGASATGSATAQGGSGGSAGHSGATGGANSIGGSASGGSSPNAGTAGVSIAGGGGLASGGAAGASGGASQSGGSGSINAAGGSNLAGNSNAGVGGGASTGEFCPSRWCWSNPLPQGNGAGSIWAFPGGDVWIGGEAATLARFHDNNWHYYPLPSTTTNNTVNSIWGSGSADLWASTGYELFRFDGSAWKLVAPPTPAVSGVSEFYYQISGSGPNDVWVAGYSGLYHFTGAGWSAAASLAGHRISFVAAASATEAWATTQDDNRLERWNGTTWSEISWSQPSPLFEGLWAAGPGSVWLIDNGAVWHGDGSTFQIVPNVDKGIGYYYYQQLFGAGTDDLWVITDGATVVHRAGQNFTTVPFDAAGPSSPFVAVGLSNGEIWLGGRWGRVWRLETDHFALVTPALPGILNTGDLSGVWSDRKGTVLAVGNAYVRNLGSGWESVPLSSGSTSANAVWGRSATDAWAVGGFATVEHYDGSTWSAVALGIDSTAASRLALYAVSGTDAGEVWAVGQSGQYLHYDPSTSSNWTVGVSDTVSDLRGLWVRTPDDVWACGQSGIVERWTRGSGWKKIASTPTADLRGIWGRSEADVWAVAGTTSLFHFDGTSWQTVAGPAGDTVALSGLAGAADGSMWAVGKKGTILHYSGSTWEREPSGLSTDLFAVATGANGEVWAVGANQFIMRRAP